MIYPKIRQNKTLNDSKRYKYTVKIDTLNLVDISMCDFMPTTCTI